MVFYFIGFVFYHVLPDSLLNKQTNRQRATLKIWIKDSSPAPNPIIFLLFSRKKSTASMPFTKPLAWLRRRGLTGSFLLLLLVLLFVLILKAATLTNKKPLLWVFKWFSGAFHHTPMSQWVQTSVMRSRLWVRGGEWVLWPQIPWPRSASSCASMQHYKVLTLFSPSHFCHEILTGSERKRVQAPQKKIFPPFHFYLI